MDETTKVNEVGEETTSADHEINEDSQHYDDSKQRNNTIDMEVEKSVFQEAPQQCSSTGCVAVSDDVCAIDAKKDIVTESIIQRNLIQEVLESGALNDELPLENANESRGNDGQSIALVVPNIIEQLGGAKERKGDDGQLIDRIISNNSEQLGDSNETKGEDGINIKMEVDDGQLVKLTVPDNQPPHKADEHESKSNDETFAKLAVQEDDRISLETNVHVDDEHNMQEDLLTTVMTVLEARHLKESRPLPVLMRGKEIDLLKLSMQVRACGGYDQTSMWSSISKTLGFGRECGPLLKLVYVKYLKAVENQRLAENQAIRDVDPSAKVIHIESSQKKRAMSSEEVVEKSDSMGQSDAAEMSRSLVEMLGWLKTMALNPSDPRKKQAPRISKSNELMVGKYEKIARKVRSVLGMEEMDLVTEEPSENPVGRPKKRGRRKGTIQKGGAKKARHVMS